jgi:multidrug efflux pump subunit AcrB
VLALSEEPFDLYHDRACLLVRLDSAGEKPEGRDRIVQAIRDRLKEVEGMTLRLRAPSQAGHFLQLNYPLDFALHGPELNSVRELAKKLAARMSESKKLIDVAAGSESVPQLFFDIDRVRLRDLGVSLNDVSTALQAHLGSLHVNDFNQFGRTWQVFVETNPPSRDQEEALRQLQVPNAKGQMVPLSNFVSVHVTEAPLAINRFNGKPMVAITANPASGVSLAEARVLCESLAEEARKELGLPAAYRLSWLQEVSAAK